MVVFIGEISGDIYFYIYFLWKDHVN